MKTIICAFLRKVIFVVLTIFSFGFLAFESEDHIGNKAEDSSAPLGYYVVSDSSVDEFSSRQEGFESFKEIDADSFEEEYWNPQGAEVDVFGDVLPRQYIVDFFQGEKFVLKKGLRDEAEEGVRDFWSSSNPYLEGKAVRPYSPSPWPCEGFGDCAEDGGTSPYVPNPWPCEELGDCAGDGVRSDAPRVDTKDGVFHTHWSFYFE